ncbi:MAG: FHA domain-containing protein [Cycloclasticus sp.]|jgi:predicted component of type VI protein secretion system|nr:FHA domain-containing protein [Cycloclasticus sp.]MEE4290661.1 FHA domain-containing protein [Cycloclasticus sp.]
MAKLALYFNNTPIDVFHLEQDSSSIGRDPSNTFVIDSLAIAPTHLKITRLNDDYFIDALSEQFPTLVNDKVVKKETLHQGDKINIGKHTLFYSQLSKVSSNNNPEAASFSLDPQALTKRPNELGTGNLQAMNGTDIGLVVTLNKAVTEINIADTTPAIIAKRHDGYYLSRLTDDLIINIDGQPITDETKLDHDATVNIGSNKYLFFIE